jgi:uncharacterized protein
MKHDRLLVPVIACVLAFGLTMRSQIVRAGESDPLQIMQKNFAASGVTDSVADATFTLATTPGNDCVRKTSGSPGPAKKGIDNMCMTQVLSPPAVKGTVLLLRGNSGKHNGMWIYLSAQKKVKRFVAANNNDSLMGTDFTYADVIGYKVSEWNYRLLKEEVVEGQPCYVIEAVPKSDAVKTGTGYSKRVSWLRKDNLMAARADYWDGAGKKLKSSTYSDIQLVDRKQGKWQAMRLEASNVQTGRHSVIKFDNFKANQQVKDEIFTTRYTEKESCCAYAPGSLRSSGMSTRRQFFLLCLAYVRHMRP